MSSSLIFKQMWIVRPSWQNENPLTSLLMDDYAISHHQWPRRRQDDGWVAGNFTVWILLTIPTGNSLDPSFAFWFKTLTAYSILDAKKPYLAPEIKTSGRRTSRIHQWELGDAASCPWGSSNQGSKESAIKENMQRGSVLPFCFV